MKRVGIFSGTFDPIHNGHLQFAAGALETSKLDKIFFLAEQRPRRKQGVRAFEHRLNMIQLVIEKEPKFGLIMLGQPRFTPQDTLPLLLARFQGAELYTLMGDDMLKSFGDWPGVEVLVKHTQFIIGIRSSELAVLESLQALDQNRDLQLDYQLFQDTAPDISSTKVRAALRKNGISADVSENVLAYIKTHGLYSKIDS